MRLSKALTGLVVAGIMIALIACTDAIAQPQGQQQGRQGNADREAMLAKRQAMEQEFREASPAVGEQAPDITLTTTGGHQVSISDHYADKPVVIEFGSITFPAFRGRIQMMERVKQMIGDFFLVEHCRDV